MNRSQLFHKLKAIVGYTLATVIIIFALTISGIRFMLSVADLYQQEVEQFASTMLGHPVTIGNMDANLSGLTPTVVFKQVSLKAQDTGKPLVTLSRIDVGLSIRDLVFKRKLAPAFFTLRGITLDITRKVDGEFQIKGFDLNTLASNGNTKSDTPFSRWLLQRSEIGIEDSTVIWRDEQKAGLSWTFENVNMLLRNAELRHQLLVNINLPRNMGNRLDLAIDIQGELRNPKSWKGKAYLSGPGLRLNVLHKYWQHEKFRIRRGVADIRVWGDWEDGKLVRFSGDVSLHKLQLGTQKTAVDIEMVSGKFDARKQANQSWALAIEKLKYEAAGRNWPSGNIAVSFERQNNQFKRFLLRADYLQVEEVKRVLLQSGFLEESWQEQLNAIDPAGDIRNISLHWANDNFQELQGNFQRLHINAWKSIPAVDGLSGSIRLGQHSGKIDLDSTSVKLEFPRLFRHPLELQKLSAAINLYRYDDAWLVEARKLVLDSKIIQVQSWLQLMLPLEQGEPYLSLVSSFSQGDVALISRLYPYSIMGKELLAWLDKSLVAGRVTEGGLVFNGSLKHFPFQQQQGQFQVALHAEDFRLDYQPSWPVLENAVLDGVFTDRGMQLNFAGGNALGNTLDASSAQIANFTQPLLQLQLQARGSAHDAMQFMVQSPILPKAADTVATMRIKGNVVTSLDVALPLNSHVREQHPLSYQGSATISNADVRMLQDKIDITALNGEILYDQNGQRSRNLSGQLFGEAADFSLGSENNHGGVYIRAQGKMQPGLIMQRFELPGASYVHGRASYKGELRFPGTVNPDARPNLTVTSNLQGVSSDLPDMLLKKSETRTALLFKAAFLEDQQTQLYLELDNNLSSALLLDHRKKHTQLSKGAISFSETKASLPQGNVVTVIGSLDPLSISDWVEKLELDKPGKGDPFFVTPIVMNLKKLNVVLKEDTDDNKNAAKSRAPRLETFPLFNGIIQQLIWDSVSVGQVDFKTSRGANSIVLDELILMAPHMKLVGGGFWREVYDNHFTELDLTMSSDNFGQMLTDLGFKAIVGNGNAKAVGKISWNGAPTQFRLADLNGNIQLTVKDGVAREVDAGAGRLLGFFSLMDLPKKLIGDFSEFKSGFSFDEASGNVELETGDAYTKEFHIKSKLADIYLSGRMGLADKDYDQKLRVVPNVIGPTSGLVALLVSLPAGIGVWLVDKMTGEKINKASARIYEITGTWEKPNIKEVAITNDEE